MHPAADDHLVGPPARPSLAATLFGPRTAEAYARTTGLAADLVARRARTVDRPRSRAGVEQLRRAVAAVDLDTPLGDDAAALRELDSLYLEHAVWFHHPQTLAHLNCPVSIPALGAETLLSAVNTSMDTWDQSTSATLIEQRLVAWVAGRIGFATGASGTFTSGGTQSNLHGLLLAREAAQHRSGATFSPLRFVATDQAHFSVATAARLLGLGPDGVLSCPTGPDRRMDPRELDGVLTAARARGETVAAVVATAGTTDLGLIDPLDAVADVCARHGVRLHVDAAYGCGLLVSPTGRSRLSGIERADTVTVDFHKSFFQPISCSALVVRDADDLRRLTWHADYLNPQGSDLPNLVDTSLQTTRRFDALKLWTTLRTVGADAIGAAFDRVLELAREAHDLALRHDDLSVAAEPSLSTLLFRYHPAGLPTADAERLVDQIRDTLFADGAVILARTRLDGRPWLKITLLDPTTTVTDLEATFAAVRRIGAALVEADTVADAVLREALEEVSAR